MSLRERIETHVALGLDASPGFFLSEGDLREIAGALRAADEIELLRAWQRARLEDDDAQRAEREKLRSALVKVQDRADNAASVEAEEALNEIGHIADEALAEQ